MRAKLTLVLALFSFAWAFSQTARVQIIHNSPEPTVDIYANADKLLDNFVFRTATPFIDVPAGVDITIGVAPANSTSAADAIATFPVQFEDGKTYVVVAAGVVGSTPGFNLFVNDMGQETVVDGNVGILFFHGSPDAPEVDIVAGGSPIFDDVSFGGFSGYLEVPAASYDLDVTPGNDNSTVVASYIADLSFWSGRTATVFASGFLGGGTPGFEPWVALDNGGTFPLKTGTTPPPPPPATGARLQIIHNSPTPTVDVWVNDNLLLDNFAFRTATPFVDVPSDVMLTVGIALANSTSASDALVQYDLVLDEGKTYIAVANGIVGGDPGFNLEIFDMGMETADDPNNVGLLFFHGSPDAPEVDIVAGGSPIFDDVEFGEFSGYINVPAGSYNLSVTPANDNNTVVAKYIANIDFWKGRTAVVFASGFLGGNDPGFEPWVALSNGGTFPLAVDNFRPENPSDKLVLGNPGNYETVVFPNPASNELNLRVNAMTGNEIRISVVNLLGQTLLSRRYSGAVNEQATFNVDISNLNSGTYFLKVQDGQLVESLPFQVVR